jgi:hypothetical protein
MKLLNVAIEKEDFINKLEQTAFVFLHSFGDTFLTIYEGSRKELYK